MGDLEVKLFSALIIEFIGKDLYKKFIKTNPYLSLHFHKGINKKKIRIRAELQRSHRHNAVMHLKYRRKSSFNAKYVAKKINDSGENIK